MRLHRIKRGTPPKKKLSVNERYPKASAVFITNNEINTTEISHSENIKLNKFSTYLKTQQYSSETWFDKKYRQFEDINDFYNKPLGHYIPDISNYRFKYIIEIDGSIHNREDIKQKDKTKTAYYNSKGYRVIRVRAYNEEDFIKVLYILNIIRKKIIKKDVNFDTQESIDKFMCVVLGDHSEART